MEKATVSFEAGEAIVWFQKDRVTTDRLIQTITKLGFRAQLLSVEEVPSQKR